MFAYHRCVFRFNYSSQHDAPMLKNIVAAQMRPCRLLVALKQSIYIYVEMSILTR
jgi:hypothetical protein